MSSPGIAERAQPCWVLVQPDGVVLDHDGEPHFGTEDEATTYATAERRLGLHLTARQRESTCHVVMAIGGHQLDEYGDGVVHWDSDEEAALAARDWGWKVTGDALVCDAGADCDECVEALAEAGTTNA